MWVRSPQPAPFIMNITLIVKLAKLANNNPNDNEANLAARKVCRLIEEGGFVFKEPNLPPVVKRDITYDDLYRATESFWKGHKPTGPGSGFSNWKEPSNLDDFLKDYYRNFTDFKRPSQQKEERELVCVECKVKKKTKFVGLPECYICNECQWTMYTKHKR